MNKWHKMSEEQPNILHGEFLTVRYITGLNDPVYNVLCWAKNLRKTRYIEFDDPSYDRGGFYTFTDDMFPVEIPVEAWQEIERYER